MAFWSRKEQYVKPLIEIFAESYSDLLTIAWAHGLGYESEARLSSDLAPPDKTELKPAPSLWVPQSLRELGKEIAKNDGWVYDEESRALHPRRTEDYSPPPIMVETFASLVELVEAVISVDIFVKGQELGLSDRQMQEIWIGASTAVDRYWQAERPDQFQLVTQKSE